MPRNKTGIWTSCEWCGKKIYKTRYQFNKHKHHYCSNKCQSEEKHYNTHENRLCEICGKTMYVSKKSTQRFCSDECQNIWQSQQIGLLNKRCTKQFINCKCCGKEFLIKKYKVNDGASHFCSTKCRQKWYADVWSQQDEWKEKSRKRQANALKNYTITTQTKPQVIVNNMLEKNNIKYENEHQFIYYSVDNYLLDHNLIIEVMGDYWHSNPIKYKQLNDMQKKNVRRDKSKHSFLLQHYCINVLYLWEKDIIDRPYICEALIQKYISNNGQLLNYHSFNYEFENNLIVLNEDLIIPFQDMSIEEINQHLKIAI